MDKFVKLVESDIFGQILVMKDQDDNGCPAIKIYVMSEIGLMSKTYSFLDNDDGYEKTERLFDELLDETIEIEAKNMIDML